MKNRNQLFLVIFGLMLIFIGLVKIAYDKKIIPILFYQYNPPVYNTPPESTKLNSATLLDLINQKRSETKLKPLIMNQTLKFIAYLRAKTIIDTQEFTHEATRSGLMYDVVAKKVGYPYKRLKENLAIGFKKEESVLNGWMNSKKHAEIILANDVSEVGIYSLEGNFYGINRIVTVLIEGEE